MKILIFIAIITAYLLALALITIQSRPTTYGVSYEFMGEKGYSVVVGDPVEIIDTLTEDNMKVLNITPIR